MIETIENYCVLCGSTKVDGICPNQHTFKKMCLNCAFLGPNEEGKPLCLNETNMKNVLDKMHAALSEFGGYNVTRLEVEPVPLKNPTKKCGEWALSEEVKEKLTELFV